MPATHTPLLLASSSLPRKALLKRLGLPFICVSPDIDETPLHAEKVACLVGRLSEAKAQALKHFHPEGLIIGSDQALILDGDILGKPGTHENARTQLQRLSGREAVFHTGLCLLNAATGNCQSTVERFRVRFRPLKPAAIERYLTADKPYDCAGSFKAEGLGVALFEGFHGRDPSSLIGLPLMALVDFLHAEGVQIP